MIRASGPHLNSAFRVFIFSLVLMGVSPVYGKPLLWNEFPLDLKNEVLSKFSSLKSENPSLEDLDRLLRYLMAKGTFEELQIVETDQQLKLEYRLMKSIEKITFKGMSSFDSNDLVQVLQLERGQKFDPRLLLEIREKIKGYYIEQGFLSVNLDIGVVDLSENQVELMVDIREGSPLRIKSIELNTPNPDLSARLYRRLKKYSGKIYNPQILRNIPKDIQDYFKDHGYIRATLSGPETKADDSKLAVTLNYKVERTERYSVVFEGNYMFPTPRLINALELNTLNSATPNILPELLTKLKEFYWKKGYARVEINGEEKILKPQVSSQLHFKVKEGPLIKIETIDMQGQLSQPARYYVDFLKEHSGPTISRNLFHRNDFENGLKTLLIELQNSGYLKARLISSRYLYNKNKDRMQITVNIEEGPLTRIRTVSFNGLRQLDANELTETLTLKKGSPLKLNELEQNLQRLKLYCQEKGFLEFRILNEKENLVFYNSNDTEADINFQIEEGPQVRVASILIDGNSLTKEYVLRKELDFKEGDILTPSKVEESTRRLQKLGIFNLVEIRTLEQRTQISERTVVVKVSERAPGLFNLGAGFTNEREFTLRGFAGIAYRNIQGTARAISTRAEVNYNVADVQFPELKLTAGYLEPYLMESLTRGRVNFTRAILVDSYVNRTATDSYQLQFLLERNLTSHILLTYDLWNISHLRDFFIKNDQTQNELNLASTGPGIEFDFRDHPFNPTKGTLTRMQLEYSHPFLGNTRSVEYLKTTGSFTHYLPFQSSSAMVLANSLRLGDIKNLSGNDGVPYNKKGFVLGGISTIRGFEAGTNERFPNERDLGIASNEIYLLQDRAQYFLVKSELRFPIWGSVGGAVFYDGGLVKVDRIHFKDPYRDAAGFGIRYATPVGPANLEFAWKLDTDRERGESPFRMHISIGTF